MEFNTINVLGGWQTAVTFPADKTAYPIGPIFNKTTDAWAWQGDNLPKCEQPNNGNPWKVREYTIELQTYHSEIVGRLQYRDAAGALQESALYSLGEISNILALWRADELLGSFGIGAVLADNATFTMVQK